MNGQVSKRLVLFRLLFLRAFVSELTYLLSWSLLVLEIGVSVQRWGRFPLADHFFLVAVTISLLSEAELAVDAAVRTVAFVHADVVFDVAKLVEVAFAGQALEQLVHATRLFVPDLKLAVPVRHDPSPST